jgi:hypothetical protein
MFTAKYSKQSISLVVLLAAGAASLAASTVLPLNLKELSVRAQRVTVGKIASITSYKDSVSGRIFSRVQVAETQTLSGAAPSSVTFEMVGGVDGDVQESIAGFPTFRVGDKVVLFLRGNTATPVSPTVGMWQGVFFVETGANGAETVSNHARQVVAGIRGDQVVISGPRTPGGAAPVEQSTTPSLTLDSFLSQVKAFRSAASAGGR